MALGPAPLPTEQYNDVKVMILKTSNKRKLMERFSRYMKRAKQPSTLATLNLAILSNLWKKKNKKSLTNHY